MQRLAPEQVEVLRRGARIGDPDVAFGCQLEEALQARAGMLRRRALVAVGEEEGQARRLFPLGQAGNDELVHDDLGPVREVAVLSLPADQRLRSLGAVAVLEPERRILRQRAVVQLEGGAGADQVLDRGPAGAGARIVEHEVALAERAALGVLAGEPDRHVLEQ